MASDAIQYTIANIEVSVNCT